MANYFLYQNIYNDQDRFTKVKEESEVKDENRFTGDLFLLCYRKLVGLYIETQKWQLSNGSLPKIQIVAWSSNKFLSKLKINHLYRASIWCWESCSPGRSRKWRPFGYETTSCNCYRTWWYYPSFEINIKKSKNCSKLELLIFFNSQ